MASPAVTLNSPADEAHQNPLAAVLNFTGTDADSNGILYNVQIDTVDTFDSDGGNPLLDLLSDRNLGFFDGTPSPNFADPFRDTVLDTTKWTLTLAGGATASYSSSGMSLNYPSSSTAATAGKIASKSTIDLTDRAVYFHTTARPANATNADAFMWLFINNDNWIRIGWEAGTIYAQCKVTNSLVKNVSLNDASFTYKHFRIRTAGGTLYWDISADGETYTNMTSLTYTLNVTALQVIYDAVCNANESNPGAFTFNGFNIPLTYASGTAISLASPLLDEDMTYYWRVRGKDPNGSNTYGSWSAIRSFVTETQTLSLKMFNGATWDEVDMHSFVNVS